MRGGVTLPWRSFILGKSRFLTQDGDEKNLCFFPFTFFGVVSGMG